jgi:hypothetical protein
LLNSLSSLLDVVNEKQLKSFGISKGNFEELPWRYIVKKLKEIFIANTLHITICTGEVTIPLAEARNNIIQEKHASAVATQRSNEDLSENTTNIIIGKT